MSLTLRLENPRTPIHYYFYILFLYIFSQWSFYLHAADSYKEPHDVCSDGWVGVELFAARKGGRTFPWVSRGGVEVFSETRAEISQPPPLPVINDHSLRVWTRGPTETTGLGDCDQPI